MTTDLQDALVDRCPYCGGRVKETKVLNKKVQTPVGEVTLPLARVGTCAVCKLEVYVFRIHPDKP